MLYIEELLVIAVQMEHLKMDYAIFIQILLVVQLLQDVQVVIQEVVIHAILKPI